jgi:hypothetical protein
MTVQLICPWCQDEAAFSVSETEDEIVCSSCSAQMAFAPDPATTYDLLYSAAA